MMITRKQYGSPKRTVHFSPLNKFCKRETCASETMFKLARRNPKGTFKTVTDAWNWYHGVSQSEVINTSLHLSLRLTGSDILQHLKALYRLVMVTIHALQLFYLMFRERKDVLMAPFFLFRIRLSLVEKSIFYVKSGTNYNSLYTKIKKLVFVIIIFCINKKVKQIIIYSYKFIENFYFSTYLRSCIHNINYFRFFLF